MPVPRSCVVTDCTGDAVGTLGYCRPHQLDRYLGIPADGDRRPLKVCDVGFTHLGQAVKFMHEGNVVSGLLCGVHGEYLDGYTTQTLRVIWGNGDEWSDYEFNGFGPSGGELDTLVEMLG